MSYPYPPMDPGQQPPGGGWGSPPPPPPGYGQTPAPGGWQGPETVGWQPTLPGGWQSPEPAGPMGPMGPMGPPPPPKKSNGGLVIGAIIGAVVLLIVVIGGAYMIAANGNNNKDDPTAGGTGTSTPSGGTGEGGNNGPPPAVNGQYKPSYYETLKSWSLWSSISDRTKDPKPMTLAEVFTDPDSRAEKGSDGRIFNLQQGTGRIDTDCVGSVWGAQLKTALQGYGCTQVLRAIYVSNDNRFVGQMAVYNLRDDTSANRFVDDLDPKSNKGFLVSMGTPAPADKLGKGSSGATTGAYGHFVVVGWAGTADGSTVPDSDLIAPSSAVREGGKEFLFERN